MERGFSVKKQTRNLLVGAGIVAAGVTIGIAIDNALTRKLVSVALDRDGVSQEQLNSQSTQAKICGFENNEEFFTEIREASAKLLETEMQTVSIKASDGTELIGHLYPAQKPKRIVIAMHGWRSSWSMDFGTITDFLHQNNCTVLYVEQRGQGTSGGDYMGFGLIERHDCKNWVDWAFENVSDSLPIYLAGISMGGATVLMASDLPLPQTVRGIVADCAFTSPHAIWKHVITNNLHLSYAMRYKAVDGICKKKLQVAASDFSVAKAMENNKIPVLFIHGTDDHFVPVEMTFENYKACSAPKRLLVVPGADHGMSYYMDRENYQKAILEFWKDFDNCYV